MADELEKSSPLYKCVTQMADIVDVILGFVPGRSLECAAQVCVLWRDAVARLRRTRRDCVTLVQLKPLDNHCKPHLDFTRLLVCVATEPQAALLFTYGVSKPSGVPFHIKEFKKQLHMNLLSLPRRCELVGCTSYKIHHNGKREQKCLTTKDYLEDKGRGIYAIVLIPRIDGVCVKSFHLPLRNKYKSISGLWCFLPDMEKPVKLVIVLAHPLSLGKLTKLAVTIKKKYGEKTVVAGCYSDSLLFHSSRVTYREIVGLVFSGHIRAASIIIDGSSQNEFLANLHEGLVRMKSVAIPSENSMAIMFSSPAHQFIDSDIQCKAFQHHYPNVPVTLVYGTAVYGCDTVELDMLGRKAGGRDLLHTESTILCVISLA